MSSAKKLKNRTEIDNYDDEDGDEDEDGDDYENGDKASHLSNSLTNSTNHSKSSGPRFRAQRKFASNAIIPERFVDEPKTVHPKQTRPIDIFPSTNIDTNDFLTFLCFRNTEYLPEAINFENPEVIRRIEERAAIASDSSESSSGGGGGGGGSGSESQSDSNNENNDENNAIGLRTQKESIAVSQQQPQRQQQTKITKKLLLRPDAVKRRRRIRRNVDTATITKPDMQKSAILVKNKVQFGKKVIVTARGRAKPTNANANMRLRSSRGVGQAESVKREHNRSESTCTVPAATSPFRADVASESSSDSVVLLTAGQKKQRGKKAVSGRSGGGQTPKPASITKSPDFRRSKRLKIIAATNTTSIAQILTLQSTSSSDVDATSRISKSPDSSSSAEERLLAAAAAAAATKVTVSRKKQKVAAPSAPATPQPSQSLRIRKTRGQPHETVIRQTNRSKSQSKTKKETVAVTAAAFSESDEEPLAAKIAKKTRSAAKITKLSVRAKCRHDEKNNRNNPEQIEKWLQAIPRIPNAVRKTIRSKTVSVSDLESVDGDEGDQDDDVDEANLRETNGGRESEMFTFGTTTVPDDCTSDAFHLYKKSIPEAPVFEPSEKEFQNPIEYIEKIRKNAERFGICRIIPPASFKPECKINDDMRFSAYNHYVQKMFKRWGPNTKLLAAIKECLNKQDIKIKEAPILGSMEIDLASLYNIVQSLGGLRNVIVKQKWPKVVELMKVPKNVPDACTKLDDLYCKYLLPYETISLRGKTRLLRDVENEWNKKADFRLKLAQKRIHLNVDSDEEDDDEDDDEFKSNVEDDSLECIIKGNKMALRTFYRIARNTMSMWYDNKKTKASQIEQDFWSLVGERSKHICVYSGSIDSGGYGYGFVDSGNGTTARHPWNLKVLTNNESSILKYMGSVMGLTVPTLHVGMLYTACCWYRDPHCLPWIEYLHTGADKIWYAIPDSSNQQFHKALLKHVPSYCRNKTIWLPSDTAMVPPHLLDREQVTVSRTVQKPGEFIVVFPKAFTSNICCGYVVSESVYFATADWLRDSHAIFRDICNSYEPSMFARSRLLLSILASEQAPLALRKSVVNACVELKTDEARLRAQLRALGVTRTDRLVVGGGNSVTRRSVGGGGGNRKSTNQFSTLVDEFECHFCRRNLFVSMVTGMQHDDFIYCLTHAIQYIKRKKLRATFCRLQYTYKIEEIDELIAKVAIDQKSAKKSSISK